MFSQIITPLQGVPNPGYGEFEPLLHSSMGVHDMCNSCSDFSRQKTKKNHW